MALLNHRPLLSIPSFHSPRLKPSARVSCFAARSNSVEAVELKSSRKEYVPGVVDDIFMNVFRRKMVEEIGWDSEKPGYDGLIDAAHRLMVGRSNSEATKASVRILRSLFPPLLLDLYKMLISPVAGGKVAAEMVARVTAISCQWLMGTCTVNSVDLPNGSSWSSGVFVEKCKYLEESKCVGVCINTCKLPTQTFFNEYMGVPLVMEPNFSDYSCQFKFGVSPPQPEDDSALKEPCLHICPTANRRKELTAVMDVSKCPKA
ncbi:Beta-carotene isomerase D27, chloroplastic [Sesamum alatum]|uniref:Beta-carotene isomerase D27, chloroplastic n=1 Tax=Sesamum alatum TaxID=300844 RepID=A0AAE1XU71_9LAMI|nr:Beta-carotene isomerase D27, chloroplastic [Sesamum alatum]